MVEDWGVLGEVVVRWRIVVDDGDGWGRWVERLCCCGRVVVARMEKLLLLLLFGLMCSVVDEEGILLRRRCCPSLNVEDARLKEGVASRMRERGGIYSK